MTRDELILRTRQLIAEGERLDADPSMTALTTWLQLCDDLLSHAWGTMDRYHLAWLMVGKPKDTIRGRAMTPGEEAAYVREVASQKTATKKTLRLRITIQAPESKKSLTPPSRSSLVVVAARITREAFPRDSQSRTRNRQ